MKAKRPRRTKVGALSLPGNLPAGKPHFVAPMKPRLRQEPPPQGEWSYELKFDGVRLIAVKAKDRVQLISRNQNELAGRFPEIAQAIGDLPANECVIDGEVVALDAAGRSSFQLLQGREMKREKEPVFFYVFDLLQAEGRNLVRQPLEKRKAWLHELCGGAGDPIRYSGEMGEDAEALLREVQRRGLEGIIGKERGSIYEPDRRSGAWIKLKVLNEQEFVIGGYTPPAGARQHLGALLVGYYERKRLLFAGKVGSGFSGKMLSALQRRFQKVKRDDCPFADLPTKQNGEWVQGLTPGMMRRMHWLDPVYVCQVRFAEWTREGKLRQPVFLGLREDKTATEVKREMARD